MKLTDFDYHLPESSIAQQAAEPRDNSKLLCINPQTETISEHIFHDIVEKLWENDVLVLNKTKVINARLKGYFLNANGEEKECEIFLHKQISKNTWDCLVYPGRKLKIGKKVFFKIPPLNLPLSNEEKTKIPLLANEGLEEVLTGTIKEISESGRIVEFSRGGIEFLETIEQIGNIPLPPYIKENTQENSRYQTVFNEVEGSVAAPTAGLHFTEELLQKLQNKWVQIEKVLLHVGLGTFKNVETENIEDHHMHSEYIELSEETAKNLNTYKKQGKRIISVGTTSIRVLESFTDENGIIHAGKKDTNIFIYPGYEWRFVDAIITNFHLPKSTLLMLVSSFAGKDFILRAYNYAVENNFRFFSYGDAMFIETKKV